MYCCAKFVGAAFVGILLQSLKVLRAPRSAGLFGRVLQLVFSLTAKPQIPHQIKPMVSEGASCQDTTGPGVQVLFAQDPGFF